MSPAVLPGRRTRWLAPSLAALAVAMLAGCAGPSPLETELSSALASSNGSLVLSDLDAVDGTGFLIVCPYDTESSIAERLGFDWAGAPDYSRADDRQTIAIIRDGDVVSSAELTRTEVDFCAIGSWDVLPVEAGLLVDVSVDPVRVTAPS